MARKKSVAALQAEALKLQAQLDQAKREEREQERKRQMKIEAIIGRLLFAEFNAEPEGNLARKVCELAAKQLTLKTERALFGLEPLPENRKAGPKERKKAVKETGASDGSDSKATETSANESDNGALKHLFGQKPE